MSTTQIRHPRESRFGFAGPAILICAGLLILLAAIGAIDPLAAWRLLLLWPAILILLGVELVVNWSTHSQALRAMAAVAVIVAAVAASMWAIFTVAPASSQSEFSADTGTISRPQLVLNTAGATVQLTSSDLGSRLYLAHVQGAQGDRPSFQLDRTSGILTVDMSRSWVPGFSGDRKVDLQLNSALPWTIELNGAGIKATGDVTGSQIRSINVSGAGMDLELAIGSPSGTVPVTLSGVGCSIKLTVPAKTAVVVSDASGFASVHNNAVQNSSAPDRYEVSLSGIGASLTVNTQS